MDTELSLVPREFKKLPGFAFPVRIIHPKAGIVPPATRPGNYTIVDTDTNTGTSEEHVHHAVHEGEAWNIAQTYMKPCHIIKLLNPKGEVRWISRHEKYLTRPVEPQLKIGI